MGLPVRKPTKPAEIVTHNAPAASGGTVGLISGLVALTQGWPWYGALALVVVGLAAGIAPQHFTRPGDEP